MRVIGLIVIFSLLTLLSLPVSAQDKRAQAQSRARDRAGSAGWTRGRRGGALTDGPAIPE